MKIGELARQVRVSVDTLRFWEKQGLLEARRTGSGYRDYDQADLTTLSFIQAMKSLGFSLADIRELLAIRVDKDSHSCGEVKALAQAHLDEVEQRLAQLERVRQALKAMVEACQGGNAEAHQCTILDALEAQGDPLG
ncbi:Zn(2+)-responsive transcriptional regulator [Gallaecimonas kandeliae]|uniref:Zn(2+)-responsive transcriptional regulator n=1 Tax=Gallaecimonas kandeliae TaxID=3029055 RepID=UPI002648D6B3|nr:Zn(2+)-responsive transcriptional regulator [Gallaecimonas kandeliae]WKE65033.1 Zn(2+)-responsive transcriptional regulator [Gallaecimonas kandeliae]